MNVFTYPEVFPITTAPVVTTGTFDGVHYGHRKLISAMRERAAQIGGCTVLITFFPHPRMILHPEDTQLKLLTTLAEKIELLEQLGVDHLLIVPFTRDFSNLSSADFIQQVLVDAVHTKKLVIGYDHRFGKDREGSFKNLKISGPLYGFDVEEIPEQDLNDMAVSSTKIRQALLDGDIKTASEYLTYPYMMNGTVVRGDQIGRTIGFPTANISISEAYKLIPKDGIYAVKVTVKGNRREGMLYIGNRPVVGGTKKTIEVNIFDFNEFIYNEPIRVELVAFVRDDENFNSLDTLKVQMEKDKQTCLELLQSSIS